MKTIFVFFLFSVFVSLFIILLYIFCDIKIDLHVHWVISRQSSKEGEEEREPDVLWKERVIFCKKISFLQMM